MKILLLFLATTGFLFSNPAKVMAEGREEMGKEELGYRWIRTGESKSPSLLLFLHGAGERGDDNQAQLRHGVGDLLKWLEKEKKNCVVIAPQCPRGVWWGNHVGNFKDAEGLKMGVKATPQLETVLKVVEKLAKQEKVDRKRIYITGLSMGGYGTFEAIARKPKMFAAAIPVCGGGDWRTAKNFKDLPIWVFHGDADGVVPVAMSRRMVKALKEAGGNPKLTEYPGVGHDSWSATYRDGEVWKWLFTQKAE